MQHGKKALSAVGEENPALARKMRARATEHDPALAGASLDEICDAVRSGFEPRQLGTLGALLSELICKVMAQPGALRLMAASPWFYSMSKGMVEGHRNRCKRAAGPTLPMEARCTNEKPGIDCLRACRALSGSDPRATVGRVLRSALALAGVDASAARATSETPLLLLRPARAALKSFRHLSEWALAFQHYNAAKGQLSSEYAVRLQLRTDPASAARTTAYVHLGPCGLPGAPLCGRDVHAGAHFR